MDTRPMREVAMDYATELRWSVFPVRRFDKRPLIKDWPHQATTDPFQIWAWWQRWPDANVGHPTGSFFDVLDVDSMAARVDLEDVCMRIGHAFTGPISKTGRGWQYLYAPTGLRNRKPSLEGIDFRGAGGYVVLPGSVHATGNVYTWLRLGTEFPEMPATLREYLWPRRITARRLPSELPAGVRPHAWAEAALRGLMAELSQTPTGKGLRNDALNRLGFRAFQLAHLLGEEEVEAAVLDAAEANGYVGDHGLARTLSTVQSAKAGVGHPRFPGGTP